MPTDEFELVNSSIQKIKKSIMELVSVSKTSSVLSVFDKKMTSFSVYVKENNWRTLTRMSERVSAQLSGHINKETLGNLANSVLRDFAEMVKVTENSVLSRKDKSEIISRISNLEVEMKMILKSVSLKNAFTTEYAAFDVVFNNWLSKISPDITLGKIQIEDVGKFYVLGMFILLFVSSAFFVMSFFVNKWAKNSESKNLESKLEDYISECLLGGDLSASGEFTKNFQIYSQRISEYLNKRMSFGSIFQDALPLSSILLDKNLKVIWANQQFCDSWEISEDEVYKEYMSWDYLNKLTNIGSDDPVLEALKNNVAGIYQVKIKPNHDARVKPYEMFVSPVKHKNEKRIMLFFYDLTNLEDTIQDQAYTIINPVKASLSQLIQGEFKPSEKLEYDFKIAGISDVYDSFVELDQNFKNHDQGLGDQVDYLCEKISNFDQSLTRVHEYNMMSLQNNKESINALKVFKQNVIDLSNLCNELDGALKKSTQLSKSNTKTLTKTTDKLRNMKTIAAEMVSSLPRFDEIKYDIKSTKAQFSEARSRLSHELTQLNMILKRIDDKALYTKLSTPFVKVEQTFSFLSKYADEMDKKFSMLDIYLSKAQMVMNSSQAKMNDISTNFEEGELVHSEQQNRQIQQISFMSDDKISQFEQGIISSLQDIFKGTKNNLEICHKIDSQKVESDVVSIAKNEISSDSQAS